MRLSYQIIWRACLSLVVCLSLGLSFHQPAQAQNQDPCPLLPQDVATPLNDLGSRVYIRMDGQNTGFTGGLYPGGSNLRPPAHEAAGMNLARRIVPLDQNGVPNPTGKIVMIGIGMSNAWQEFNAFVNQAKPDPGLNPALVIVNGAQPGRTTEQWIDPNADSWTVVDTRLSLNHVTPAQVQVAWVKNTLRGGGNFPALAQSVQADFEMIARNLKTNFPNIKIAYFSSRTNSYTYWRALSPEPNAYETGFSVKWMIEKQINGDPTLNYDPARGPVVAPFLSWGPYLWADGPHPRSDGLVWLATDMVIDCTHPSAIGEAKVGRLLMDFFMHDTTTDWFRDGKALDWIFYLPLIIRLPLADIP